MREQLFASGATRMDRSTKTILRITFIMLGVYLFHFYADCARDVSCHAVCRLGVDAGCGLKSPNPKIQLLH
jgi:hypothetical protein